MRVIPIIFLLLLASCGGGDDDGRRLGEVIVGTWQRGWGEGDVVIEGNTDLRPENFAYDQFVFNDDGSYNGMVRNGTFIAYDTHGSVIFEGKYQCDNHNMKLEQMAKGRCWHKWYTLLTTPLSYDMRTKNIT